MTAILTYSEISLVRSEKAPKKITFNSNKENVNRNLAYKTKKTKKTLMGRLTQMVSIMCFLRSIVGVQTKCMTSYLIPVRVI